MDKVTMEELKKNSIALKLSRIQNKLKAPKSQTNGFGKYQYRSCEDILEAVKPLLLEEELCQIISDEIICLNAEFERSSEITESVHELKKTEKSNISKERSSGRFYIKSTVTIVDCENNQLASTGYAREEEKKKGMDSMQLTGATSSYARKYALNALYSIDDTKDSDATNDGGSVENKLKAITNTDGLNAYKTELETAGLWSQSAKDLFNEKFKSIGKSGVVK